MADAVENGTVLAKQSQHPVLGEHSSSSMPVSVFLFGATGFLGGSVLSALEQEGYDITCLVRPGKEHLLEKRKVKQIVTGDFSSLDLIERTAAENDVAINAADSDDIELTKAINRGLVQGRKAGRKGVLVHISGTQVVESLPSGKLEEDWPIFDDADLAQIEGIDLLAAHREIDDEIARADLAGEITASIICPSLIYGVGAGPDKIISSLIPDSVRRGLRFGRVPVGGKGTNVWSDVHVEDVASLIVASMKHNLEGPPPAGYSRFYFAENGENDKVSLSKRIAAILHRKGKISDDRILHVPIADSRAPGWANKTTVRCRATRGREELGWSPKHTLNDQELEEDVAAILMAIG